MDRPVERMSGQARFACYPDGVYRYEGVEERRNALFGALRGVELSAEDRQIVMWLADWEISTVVVTLVCRACAAAVAEGRRCGGESR